MTTNGTPLADRAALARTVEPVTGAAAESMRQATRHAERRVTELVQQQDPPNGRAGRRAVASTGRTTVAEAVDAYRADAAFSNEQVAWLTVLLRDLRVRDDAWARMDPAYLDAHLRLWTDVTRLAQPGYVAAPASLLAFVAWQGDNQALASVALDRALADDHRYTMAQLLRQVIDSGVPSSQARVPMSPEEVAASYETGERS